MRRVLLLALAALVACSSDPAPTRACTPGAQVACACPGGAASVQVCAADGSGLGACACSVADAGADAAADARPEAAVDVQLQDVAPEASVDVAADQGPEAPPPCPDVDGDGHRAASCGGDDCDDGDRLRFPGQMELCDGVDGNCDGVADGYPDGRHDPIADARCVVRVGGTTTTMHACELGAWAAAFQRCPGGVSGAAAWCVYLDRERRLAVVSEAGSGGYCDGRP